MTIQTLALLSLLLFVWIGLILAYSHIQSQKAEREAAANRHAELMKHFHSITGSRRVGNHIRTRNISDSEIF